MKKLFCTFICIITILGLTGCGQSSQNQELLYGEWSYLGKSGIDSAFFYYKFNEDGTFEHSKCMGDNCDYGEAEWRGTYKLNGNRISLNVKEENQKKRVLFTTDGTDCSLSVIKNVIKEINLADKEIHICMVNEDPNFLFLEGTLDTNWLLDIQKQQQIYASKAIDKIKTVIKKQDVNICQTSILNGIPAQEIINYAQKYNIDLIILGSRNKSKIDRFLMGSVSKRVLENVKSDVWLIRCKS